MAWVNYNAIACRTECLQRETRPFIIDSKVGSTPFAMPRVEFRVLGGTDVGSYLYVEDNSRLFEALDYQWLVDGTGVDGATLPHYTIRSQDFGKEIRCSVGRVRWLGDNCFTDGGLLTCDGWLHPSLVVGC